MSPTDYSETIEPVWTEGVCGDGAVFLRAGVPVTISGVLAALNVESELRAALEKIVLEGNRYNKQARQMVGPREYYNRPELRNCWAKTASKLGKEFAAMARTGLKKDPSDAQA